MIEEVAAGTLAALAIDMPVGLAGDGPRACDAEARRLLGRAARRCSRRRPGRCSAPPTGGGAGRGGDGPQPPVQAYNLVTKVAELDRAMRPELQGRVVEAHPELAFRRLAGGPAAHPSARRRAGRSAWGCWRRRPGDLSRVRALGAAPDDILDAAVLALTANASVGTATGWATGRPDARGLRMEVAY